MNLPRFYSLRFLAATALTAFAQLCADYVARADEKAASAINGPEDELHRDTEADRHRFLGFATLLMAGLSAVATIYVALVYPVLGSWKWGGASPG